MSDQQRVVICTLGYSGWYPRGVARMIERFHVNSPGYEIRAWVNVLPESAPTRLIEDGYDYTAYCAKPLVLWEAMQSAADIAILLDASFYPIRSIFPLVDYIAQNGYYFCDNGFKVGEWSSDRCLDRMSVNREEAFGIREISSYCVGLNFTDLNCCKLLNRWCSYSYDLRTIPGPHSNSEFSVPGHWWNTHAQRNKGFVSSDPRVCGHRHDQTVLSILAHQFGMNKLLPRPLFTAYAGQETDETVLVNQGMG